MDYIFINFYINLDASSFMFDENLISELTQMGFPPEACKRAVFFTKNQGLNDASNWLMNHISDPDFSDPFIPPGTEVKKEG
jgi:ubiquitin carboxyl-terminal hydrolase 5/13